MPNRLFIDELTSVGLVDRGDNPGAEVLIYKAAREFSPEQREGLADEGMAMPDGSFPIPDKDALKRAVQSIGRTKPGRRAAVMAHIKRRAKALGAADMIPQGWVKKDSTNVDKSVINIPKQGPAPHRTKGVRMPLDLTAVEDEDLRTAIEKHVADLEAQIEDSTSDDEVSKAQADKIEALEKRLAEETGKRRQVDFEKRAETFEKMLGKPDEIGPVLDALEAAAPEAYSKLETALIAAAGRVDLSKLFAEFGSGSDGETDPIAKRDAYVADQKKAGSTETVEKLRAEFWTAHPEEKQALRS
jgi:hypothetical protein